MGRILTGLIVNGIDTVTLLWIRVTHIPQTAATVFLSLVAAGMIGIQTVSRKSIHAITMPHLQSAGAMHCALGLKAVDHSTINVRSVFGVNTFATRTTTALMHYTVH